MNKTAQSFEQGHPTAIPAMQAIQAAGMDERLDPAVATVRRACVKGEYGAARLRFLQLREPSQVELLEHIPRDAAVRLAGGLPPYTVARLCERVARPLRQAIVHALPAGKRRGVSVIMAYRRRF